MQITDEMVEKACLAYWGDKNMNSMFRGKTREGIATSMRAALEAALSTDAEPVAWRGIGIYGVSKVTECEDIAAKWREYGIEVTPLYAEPVKTAPAVAGSVIKLGAYGRAYDRPEERRAYTYEHQPGNIEAHKLGRACSDVHSGGDWIDRGLNLLNALQREGFGVFELPAAPAKQEGGR